MKTRVLALIPGILALAALALIIALFVVKSLWAWVIPDLFPGAVEQGLIARSISWFTALKLAIYVAVLAGLAGVHPSAKSEVR